MVGTIVRTPGPSLGVRPETMPVRARRRETLLRLRDPGQTRSFSRSETFHQSALRGTINRERGVVEQEQKAVVFDTASGKWLRFTPDGGSVFVSDKAQASRIYGSQLEAYIRGHELEYLRYSLVAQPLVTQLGGLTTPSQHLGEA